MVIPDKPGRDNESQLYVKIHKKCYNHKSQSSQGTKKKRDLGPVVQSVVSLTSSLRVILLTVLADSIYNTLIFFAEKM